MVHISYTMKNRLRRRNRSERARASYDKHEQFCLLRDSCVGRNGNIGRVYTYNATLHNTIQPWAVILLLPSYPPPDNDRHKCSHSQVPVFRLDIYIIRQIR